MDKNIMNCPKCGHSVSDTAKACAYCGTVISSGESSSQPDEKVPATAAQPSVPPLLPSEDASPPIELTGESAGAPEASKAKSDNVPSSHIQPEDTKPEKNEPITEATPAAEDLPPDADAQMDVQLPDEELIAELEAEEGGKGMDETADLQPKAAEASAEVIPLVDKASAKAAADELVDLPETQVLEVSGDDSAESETLGAEILELIEVEASELESEQKFRPEILKESDEPAVGEKADLAQDATPAEAENKGREPEAIFLTSDDEVQSVTQSSPAGVGEAVQKEVSEDPVESAAPTGEAAEKSDDSSEQGESQVKADAIQKQTEAQASVEALKSEKAPQRLAESQKKQKVALDPALLKKQKAALARAGALKKQKLKLAKVQALKRRKAALVKAQALKKQKAAQAGVENSIKEEAAVSSPPKADNPNMVIQSMGANTRMLGLLKKYQGQAIGINYDNSAEIKEAKLVAANDEFFSVFVKDQGLNYSYPLNTILTIIEGKDGVGTGKPEQEGKFKAVIKVYPLVLF
jgi:hypothetical protein